jgi:hypothetical protein
MEYAPLVERLKEKYPPKLRHNNCYYVASDLALLVLDEMSVDCVTLALTPRTDGKKTIRETSHNVAVIKEDEGRFVALDAVRPTYDSDGEYWEFEAESESALVKKLSDHYGGEWEILDEWMHEIPEGYKGLKIY